MREAFFNWHHQIDVFGPTHGTVFSLGSENSTLHIPVGEF